MTAREQELDEAAEAYEQNKDSDDWQEPKEIGRRARRLDTVVSVRFSSAELEALRAAATPAPVSQFIRMAALAAARPAVPVRTLSGIEAIQGLSSSQADMYIFFNKDDIDAPSTPSLQLSFTARGSLRTA